MNICSRRAAPAPSQARIGTALGSHSQPRQAQVCTAASWHSNEEHAACCKGLAGTAEAVNAAYCVLPRQRLAMLPPRRRRSAGRAACPAGIRHCIWVLVEPAAAVVQQHTRQPTAGGAEGGVGQGSQGPGPARIRCSQQILPSSVSLPDTSRGGRLDRKPSLPWSYLTASRFCMPATVAALHAPGVPLRCAAWLR